MSVIVVREFIVFHLGQGYYPCNWLLQGGIDHLIGAALKVNVQISGLSETYINCRSPQLQYTQLTYERKQNASIFVFV